MAASKRRKFTITYRSRDGSITAATVTGFDRMRAAMQRAQEDPHLVAATAEAEGRVWDSWARGFDGLGARFDSSACKRVGTEDEQGATGDRYGDRFSCGEAIVEGARRWRLVELRKIDAQGEASGWDDDAQDAWQSIVDTIASDDIGTETRALAVIEYLSTANAASKRALADAERQVGEDEFFEAATWGLAYYLLNPR